MAGGLGTSAGQKFLGLGGAESTPSRTATPPTGDPIKITKITLAPRAADKTWVFPSRLSAQSLASISDEFASYEKSSDEIMRSHGGVETSVSTVELELEGNRKDVRIIDIGIDARCHEPLHTALFYNPPQGEADTVQIGYNLDRDPMIAQNSKTDETEKYPRLTGNYFADKKYTLKQGEQATFRLSAVTRQRYCEYTFELKYIADGKPDSRFIDNGGKPFRVSALIEKGGALDCTAYQQRYAPSAQGWSKIDPSRCG